MEHSLAGRTVSKYVGSVIDQAGGIIVPRYIRQTREAPIACLPEITAGVRSEHPKQATPPPRCSPPPQLQPPPSSSPSSATYSTLSQHSSAHRPPIKHSPSSNHPRISGPRDAPMADCDEVAGETRPCKCIAFAVCTKLTMRKMQPACKMQQTGSPEKRMVGRPRVGQVWPAALFSATLQHAQPACSQANLCRIEIISTLCTLLPVVN